MLKFRFDRRIRHSYGDECELQIANVPESERYYFRSHLKNCKTKTGFFIKHRVFLSFILYMYRISHGEYQSERNGEYLFHTHIFNHLLD